jgi:uncharacterized protein
VIVVDANVLIYLADADSARHAAVQAWMQRVLDEGEVLGLPWLCLVAFVRLTTLPNILRKPLCPEQALSFVEQLLADSDAAVLLESGPQHYPGFARLLRDLGSAGNLSYDAHIAAIALAHGGRLASFDRDFDRFAGITRVEPA